MFVLAYSEDSEHIAYFDSYFNKYIAKGGHLAWRINNPGLVHSHSHVATKNGSIGAYNAYAIFSTPEQGFNALSDWLHLKKYYNSTIQAVAAHYQPNNPEQFISRLVSLTEMPRGKELKSLPKCRFEALIQAIAKLCLFIAICNEDLTMLPKITGKIEGGTTPFYLIGKDIILSQTEAIDWIQSHRLDASIVHKSNGDIYLRSRPHHSFWNRGIYDEEPEAIDFLPSENPVETIVRSVGKRKAGQCVWGFINGISNTKTRSMASAELISSAAEGEETLYLPNDSWFLFDALHCVILKLSIDTPIVVLAEKFFRYLLTLSTHNQAQRPIIIFAHSQGAIVAEHALKLLHPLERGKLRIFTLGGGSFILPGVSHPDSHNYVSAADAICRWGSPRLQILALFKYERMKNGLTQKQMLEQLAMRDALLHLDSVNKEAIKAYAKTRVTHYEQEFLKISNVTVLDPDTVSFVGHEFNGPCYQIAIDNIIKRYQKVKK